MTKKQLTNMHIREVAFESLTVEEVRTYVAKSLALSQEQVDILLRYIELRRKPIKGDKAFGVVYAITRQCNLNCNHCAVAAPLYRPLLEPKFETDTEGVYKIIDQIGDYVTEKQLPVFFMIGGGEPTLRPDFESVLSYASTRLGKDNIGFCSNGTYLDIDATLRLSEFVGLLEVSLDGLEHYHNRCRDPKQITDIGNPYQITIELVKQLARSCPEKLEVSSVVTTENLRELPNLMKTLCHLGVVNYSVHRPMPVGRMIRQSHLIPDTSGFFELILSLAELKSSEDIRVHVHHSLESILSVLLLGVDIHSSDLPLATSRHSIGVDWHGNVHFDPWSLIPPYSTLSPGNLLENGTSLKTLMSDPANTLEIARGMHQRNVRCYQCRMPCSGGMRFNALASYISDLTERGIKLSAEHILVGMSHFDPACPITQDVQTEE